MEEKLETKYKMLPVPQRRTSKLAPEVKLLLRSITALVLFIIGFNFSRSSFFREYPLFGVAYLAELIISFFAAFLRFFYIPRLLLWAKSAIESLIVNTVAEIVNRFWDLQTKRIQEQRRAKQFKRSEEERLKHIEEHRDAILIDTSVLIDGRYLELAKLGFMENNAIIPQFVIDELHALSDSKDDLKRKKGRRGLDSVKDLKKKVKVVIPEIKNDGQGVDKLLIRYAREQKVKLATLDFNLNKVASVNNIKVLNINELANSLKAVLLPGEDFDIKIIHEGKGRSQGVGYLADGTMVIVEAGKDHVNQDVRVKVSKVIQSPAGKIVFAVIAESHSIPLGPETSQVLFKNSSSAV
ncbi:hypothetical protein GYA27_01255 [candidate division WWE3 bacterium]|uniref:PIN domain-containing protein n=1 Tax=candidate division WWE3 bacterium TaxID=2053526 RepID=A0A7X9DJV6_UNCKA|nr:hypothetical protein [candidate division WWE3 bacterium]